MRADFLHFQCESAKKSKKMIAKKSIKNDNIYNHVIRIVFFMPYKDEWCFSESFYIHFTNNNRSFSKLKIIYIILFDAYFLYFKNIQMKRRAKYKLMFNYLECKIYHGYARMNGIFPEQLYIDLTNE